MARPTPFDRQTSFTQFSSQFPAKPQNGASLDAEFNAVKVALDETQSNVALIQDDDGRLARGSVGRAQLDSSITLGFESPKTWQPATAYTADLSTVFREAKFYRALETHVSADTFDATKWEQIADLSASAAIDDGSITEAKLATSAVTAEKISPLAVTTPKIASAAVTNAKLADGAVTRDKLDDSIGADLAKLVLPAGLGPLPWSGRTAPAGWVLMGATYNRADYPALWTHAAAEIASGANDIYGVGDGSSTFTIADPKGRALVGVDAAASVVGSLTKPGATAGAKKTNLTQANLPSVNFTVSIPSGQGSHAHGVTGGVYGGSSSVLASLNDTSVPANATAITISAATLPAMSGTAASGGSASDVSLVQPSFAVNFIIKAH